MTGRKTIVTEADKKKTFKVIRNPNEPEFVRHTPDPGQMLPHPESLTSFFNATDTYQTIEDGLFDVRENLASLVQLIKKTLAENPGSDEMAILNHFDGELGALEQKVGQLRNMVRLTAPGIRMSRHLLKKAPAKR